MSGDLYWATNLARKNLPKYVQRVMRTVASSVRFDFMNSSERKVLYYLASLIDAEDVDSFVYPKKSTIAEKTELSEPTVYRALSALEEDGLIFREPQLVDISRGVYKIGRIRFSESFYEIVGRPKALSSTGQVNQDPAIETAEDRPQSPVGTATPSITVNDNTNQNLLYQKKNISNTSSLRSEDGYRVPRGLEWLINQGLMTGRELVSLMGRAKKVGQRVQDVVDAKRSEIEAGRIQNLAGYIWVLLGMGEDFSYSARVAREQAEAKQADASLPTELQCLLSSMTGKVLMMASGAFWRLSTSSGFVEYVDERGACKGARPLTTGFLKGIKQLGFDLVDERWVGMPAR